VIWNRRIYDRRRPKEGWQPYDGDNPHDKHMHVSILVSARDDRTRWKWAPRHDDNTPIGP
jgi:hypothetical protein